MAREICVFEFGVLLVHDLAKEPFEIEFARSDLVA
jgi:hypothetical protein